MINVLIAEDNAAYRQSLLEVLRERFPFMQITETADGTDALNEALARHYDLIFMDIRLPHGNGLDLTRIIKGAFVDSIICVITSYDLPEYRDAAFRNGADHFLVKGDSTGEEIVAMVESLLRARYRALVIAGDPGCRRQVIALLAIRFPLMAVAEAGNAREGLGKAAFLKPDLVLLDLGLADARLDEIVDDIRAVSTQARFIGMAADGQQAHRARAVECGIEYFVPLGPTGYTELASIMRAMHPGPLHR